MRNENSISVSSRLLLNLSIAGVLILALASCKLGPTTSTPVPTPIPSIYTATPTSTPTPGPVEQELFLTYAHGELLPDMRVPVQRAAMGEGGWYVVIGTKEGWAQFLSQMGQPAEIWESVQWQNEILVGALLGLRNSSGYGITISDLDTDGVAVSATLSFSTPPPDQTPLAWTTYPFHFVRVPRVELPLGSVTFQFSTAGRQVAAQTTDIIDLDIIWMPGQAPAYPTPTPPPSTSTPEPAFTPTPVPDLRVMGTVLEVIVDALTLRIVPFDSSWETVDLMEATSIFLEDGQPASLTHIVPGTTINVLGYPDESGSIRAAHIDVLRLPSDDSVFAEYRPHSLTLSTIYGGYDLPLSLDAISTTFSLTQTFDLTQTHMLTQNGFVVIPGEYPTFSSLYNDPGYITMPLFISADSVSRVSQWVFDRALHSTEQTHLMPELTLLDREMFDLSWSQYEAMRSASTPAEQRMAAAALLNAGYFAVALSLLDPEFTPPMALSPVVGAELSLIAASKGITISPLLDLPGVPDSDKLRVDYGQFSPTSHYAQSTVGSRYFRAMTWHRVIALRPEQRQETRSAVLIANTLQTHPTARVLWERIHVPLVFFLGQDASFTLSQYAELLARVWDKPEDITVLADQEKMNVFIEALSDLPLPGNPMWTIWEAKEHIERDWRFLNSPFSIDAYVFEQMTGENVGDPDASRELPSTIDLAAVLGSQEAYRVASQMGDMGYADYIDQVDKVRNELSTLRTVHWTEELHWNWLHVYRALLQDKNPSYPSWMLTSSWRRKELQTMFGGWTHLQQESVLASEPVVETGAESTDVRTTPGVTPAPNQPQPGALPPWGYVEPQPEMYGRLAALSRMIIDGLDSRLLLSAADRDALLEWEAWLIFLQDISRRELTRQPLADREYVRLAQFGLLLEKQTPVDGAGDPGEAYQGSTVARVATSSRGQLIEATGGVDELYVVVERDRQQYLARGGAFSHYEFVWPDQGPLTDTDWREMLALGRAPPRPIWINGFVAPD